MELLLRIFLEGVMGYLLQNIAAIIGMYAIARHSLEWKPVALSVLACTAFTMIVRNCGLFNFGVHTMLWLLAANLACISICKLNIRYSILGSIIMVVFLLLSEAINVGIMSFFYPMSEINTLLLDPIFKAAWAIPGTIFHLASAVVLYCLLIKKKKSEVTAV